MRQDTPWRSSWSNTVSASLWRGNCVAGKSLVNPDDVAAWKNDRLGNVWLGTSQNQWSATAKPFASVLITGTDSGAKQFMMMLYSAFVGARPVRCVNLLM